MTNINPKTGKRLGKFLFREDEEEREAYLNNLREKVSSGFYSSENVLGSIIDELAPAMAGNIGVDIVS